MKRFLALGMVLILVFSLFGSSIAYAGTTSKLNKREKAIVQAFVTTTETGDVKYLEKYKYPGLNIVGPKDFNDYNVKMKILTPEYSKKYIASEKAYCLYVSGVLVMANEYALKLAEIRIGIFVKKKGNTEYVCYQKEVDGKDIYADRIITVDKLSDEAITELEEYLVGLYGEDNGKALMYPDITDNKKSVEFKNDDEKVTITAPASWGNYDMGAENAILQIADTTNNKFLIVFMESKENFADDMSLNDYIGRILQNSKKNLKNPNASDMEQIEVNSNPAQYCVLSGEYNNIKITYIIMCIEKQNDFFKILSWTPTVDFDKSKDEMMEIMKSFKVTE